jgi:hypothetical protein
MMVVAARLRPLLATALALVLAPLVAMQARAEPPRGVIELFTSQGCSSCPPADRLMAELAEDPSFIVLSLPVDYWDYLGWKDTLALSVFTKRQKAYAASRGDGMVYTPQAVVNGQVHALGSDRAAIIAADRDTRAKTGAVEVGLRIAEADGVMRVTLPDAPATRPSTVWVLPVSRAMTVAIARGENKGRDVTYANVARDLIRVGEWSGQAATIEIPLDRVRRADCDSYVVLLQQGDGKRPGAIIGAARAGK